jgi:hypothetical protein
MSLFTRAERTLSTPPLAYPECSMTGAGYPARASCSGLEAVEPGMIGRGNEGRLTGVEWDTKAFPVCYWSTARVPR